MRKPSDLTTAGMQGAGAGSIDPAAGGKCFRGTREVGGSNDRLGNSLWSVWVSEDYGSAEGRGVAGESQEGGADLESGRIEGVEETTKTWKIMAQ